MPHGFGSQGLLCSIQPLIVLGLSRYPAKQVHLAYPLLRMAHWVLGPQGDGSHGFSGNLQGEKGGLPSYSGRQKHTDLPLMERHPEFAPQLFGWHSSPSGTK